MTPPSKGSVGVACCYIGASGLYVNKAWKSNHIIMHICLPEQCVSQVTSAFSVYTTE